MSFSASSSTYSTFPRLPPLSPFATSSPSATASTTALPLIDPRRLHYTPNDPSTRLGIGTFGIVYSGKYAGADVAVKCIRTNGNSNHIDNDDGKRLKAVWNNVKKYEHLKHPCIVQFFGVALGEEDNAEKKKDIAENDTENEVLDEDKEIVEAESKGLNVGNGNDQVDEENEKMVRNASFTSLDFSRATSLLVVTELMHGGSLLRSLDIVKRGIGYLHLSTLLRIASMISGALRFLHQEGFTSGTVKSLNVLLSDPVDGDTGKLPRRARAKLADFGLSASMFAKKKEMVSKDGNDGTDEDHVRECAELAGSAPYMSPEAWNGLNVDKPEVSMASDVYALGVVLFELITLRRPWYKATMPEIFDAVVYQGKRPEWAKEGDEDWNQHYEEEIYNELKSLVEKCWENGWEERPTAAQVYDTIMRMQVDFEKKRRERKKGTATAATAATTTTTTTNAAAAVTSTDAGVDVGSASFVDADIAKKWSKKSIESTAEEVQLDDVIVENESSPLKSNRETYSSYPDPPKLPLPPTDSLNYGMRPLQAQSAGDDEDEEETSARQISDSDASSGSADYYSAAVSLYKKPTNSIDNRTDTEFSTFTSQETFATTSMSNKEIEEELNTWVNAELKTIDKRNLLGTPQGNRWSRKRTRKRKSKESSRKEEGQGRDDHEEGRTIDHSASEKKPRAKRGRRASQSSVLEANQFLRKKSTRLDSAILEASSGAETWRDHVEAIERAAERKNHSLILSIMRTHGKDPHVARASVMNLSSVLKSESREYDFCEEGGAELLLAAASRFAARDGELAKSFCDCISTLASPYDPRICHLMRAVGVAGEVLACIESQANDPKVLTAACTALHIICGGANLERQTVASLGGSVKIHRVLSLNLIRWENVDLARAALKLCLQFAWQNSSNAEELMNLGVVDSINRISQIFTTDSKLDEDVIAVFGALANFPKGKEVITESGGFSSISSILARVGRNYRLAERCCMLVVSMTEWRDPACGEAILRSSVVEGIVTVTRMAIQLTDRSGGRLGFHAAQALLYIICYGETTRTRVRDSSGLIVLLSLLRLRKDDAYCCGRTVAAIAAMMLDTDSQSELIAHDGVQLLREVQAQYQKHEISEVCKKALRRLKNAEAGFGDGGQRRKRNIFWWRKGRKNGRR